VEVFDPASTRGALPVNASILLKNDFERDLIISKKSHEESGTVLRIKCVLFHLLAFCSKHFSSINIQQVMLKVHTERRVGLHVRCPILLYSFHEIKVLQYEIS
jgi:hypothetical protein